MGTRIGERLAIPFHYQDFRPGWSEGVQKSKELGLYRQPYCGCIFSEKERFEEREKITAYKGVRSFVVVSTSITENIADCRDMQT